MILLSSQHWSVVQDVSDEVPDVAQKYLRGHGADLEVRLHIFLVFH